MSHIHKIGILGAGESGIGAALLARKNGMEVWVSDTGKIQAQYKKELLDNHIVFEEGKHSKNKLFDMDLIIKSPGIPQTVGIIEELRERAIPIISEIEYAFRFTSSTIIAITGSNGKTTSASLLFHILKEANYKVALAGNIGKSFARSLAEGEEEYYVLEVSSFQLEDISTFRPQIAIFLNLSPDHLDRYNHSMGAYGRAKLNISRYQLRGDYLIYWHEDEWIKKLIKEEVNLRAQFLEFGLNTGNQVEAWVEGELLRWRTGLSLSFESMNLMGKHNMLNAIAVGIAAQKLEVSDEQILHGLESFKPISHRLEKVGEIDGIIFINDSKATNVQAVYYALESLNKKIVWIVGGVDKGNDYEELRAMVIKKVKHMIILGEGKEKLTSSFSLPYHEVDQMREAVEIAYRLADPREYVLLSPACASFDLFKNYMDRGNQFKEEVKRLAELKN